MILFNKMSGIKLKLIPFCVSDRGAGWRIHRRSCSHSRSPQHLFCSGYQPTCKPNGTMVHSLFGNGGLPCCHHVGAGASRNSGCRHGHCLHCGCGGGCRGIWSSWCCGIGIYWSNCCGKPCSRGSWSSNCRCACLHEDFRFYFMKLCNTSSCQPTWSMFMSKRKMSSTSTCTLYALTISFTWESSKWQTHSRSEDSRASGILKQLSHVGALLFHVHFVKSSICFGICNCASHATAADRGATEGEIPLVTAPFLLLYLLSSVSFDTFLLAKFEANGWINQQVVMTK